MELPIYQVDAFASRAFQGNPAAVIPLEGWLDQAVMQAIALENNLSETAFLVASDGAYELRWFTPTVEVELCGHATLAAAHVLFEHLHYSGDRVCFHTRSGELAVSRSAAGLSLDLPAASIAPSDVDVAVCDALGAMASEAVAVGTPAHSSIYVYEFEEDVSGLRPDFSALLAATSHCVIASAPGDECDFVSRFFGPPVGVNEDPVTGSAHCSLVPYWAQRLAKSQLDARQVSARGGRLHCELADGRVFLTGSAVTYLQGRVYLPD